MIVEFNIAFWLCVMLYILLLVNADIFTFSYLFCRDLSHNQISQLNPNAFNGVTNLTELWGREGGYSECYHICVLNTCNLFYSRYINNNQLTSLTLDSWNQFLLKVISLKNMWVLKKNLAYYEWPRYSRSL